MTTSLISKIGWGAATALALLLLASWSGIVRGGSLDPDDPPGPTMKTLQEVEPRTPISELPATVSVPGSYYFTADLVQTVGGPGITIAVDNVTIDLNGFAMSGTPGTAAGISPSGTRKNITIRNGTIRQYSDGGIALSNADNVRLQDLVVEGNSTIGMTVGARALVQDCVVRGAGSFGISTGADSVVRNCVVANSSWNGIRLGARSTASDCTVMTSGATATTEDTRAGIYVGPGGSVRACTVSDSAGPGIVVEDQTYIADNTVSNGDVCGIRTQGGGQNRFESNHMVGNAGGGLCIGTPGNIFFDNDATGSGIDFDVVGGNVGEVEIGAATKPRSNVSY